MVIKPFLRVARATTVAAVIVAASGSPLFGAINDVTLRLASVRCEKERLRQKVAEAVSRERIPSLAHQWAFDREAESKQLHQERRARLARLQIMWAGTLKGWWGQQKTVQGQEPTAGPACFQPLTAPRPGAP
jgi:hypothetical protein